MPPEYTGKKCTQCGEVKEILEFGKRKSGYYRSECNSCKRKRDIAYGRRNKEKISIRMKKYSLKRKLLKREYDKNYRELNKECIYFKRKKYNAANREKSNIRVTRFFKTPMGKIHRRISWIRRRSFGFDPINDYFKESHFHHLHLTGVESVGIFIPQYIHRSIHHNGITGDGMKEINNLAVSWLISDTVLHASFLKQIIGCEASL